ncbi:MAG: AmmeMemoRadiSam system protein A [Thiohalorhabdus sp.]|uniref:AmmeMemoRadiSam system protein A n=1 Tax=Thiohalorhabdus sp. TaxID=3094134 RepID=UPI00397F9997
MPDTAESRPAGAAASLRPHAVRLLELAGASIDHGLDRGRPLEVDPSAQPPELQEWRACFVSLHVDGGLRGCIGSVEPRRPLAVDVAENAHAAAFRDPRFPALTPAERPDLALKVEVLTPFEPLSFDGEADLLAQLRPGRDGLLLEADGRRGTFLPTVWEVLPEAEQFWTQLKRKAGLPPDRGPEGLRVYRYRTEVIAPETA